MRISVNGRDIEFVFTKEERDTCSHSGECYDDCEYMVRKHPRLFARIPRSLALDALYSTGGWTKEELEETSNNELYIKLIWVAANNANDSDSLLGYVSGY